VTTVYAEDDGKKHLWHVGNQQDTRKKLCVIAVALDQGMPANYWYVTWMDD
jgi:hypothetical protein